MKKYLSRINLIIVLNCFLFISCSGSNSDEPEAENITPANLKVTAEIAGASAQNPNGDRTGVVNFTLSAANATSYKNTFGN